MKKRSYIDSIKTLYKELLKQVKCTKKNDVINIEDIECPYNLDLRRLLIDLGLCVKTGEQDILTITKPLRLKNIKCNVLLIESICFEDNNCFQIENSLIDTLKVYSTRFSSFTIKNSSVTELTIDDSTIQENVAFDFSCIESTFPIKINFEDTIFYGDVKISNLEMIDNTSHFLMSGENMSIYGNFLLYNIRLLHGVVELSCNFEQNCIFRLINVGFDDNEKQVSIEAGTISISAGKIEKELALEYCYLNCLSIANTPVGGTREFEFSYNRLKNNAATILRDGAAKRSDFLLVEKYTADMFDTHLKDKAKDTYEKWISLLENKQVKGIKRHRLLHSLVFEPIELLIPSLTSGESFLLWLNKYSNDFNRSWTRGIAFTLIITLLSYILLNYAGMEQPYFVVDIHFNGFEEVVKGYLRLLDVFNLTGLSGKVEFELSTFGYIILFAAKVLIAYGCWQTIYAFYKYKK